MKSKFSNILKKLFLSSVTSIAANNTLEASPTIEVFSLDTNENEFTIAREKDLSPKLLLKLNNGNEWTAISHRSHRSHSSHRSHYSSTTSSSSPSRSTTKTNNSRSSGTSNPYSGSNSSPSSTPTPLKFNSNGSSNNNSNSSNSQKNSSSNTRTSSSASSVFQATSLKFGDRNLKLGMSGSDVTELINILLKKGYLQLENGETLVYGSYTYDETIEATVKRYQKNNNLTVDGNCGPTTVYHLLNK